ncbi:hypothetical protein I302_107384 [Kwoniella bestiolae CBS 10118]|uniref:Diphenol oxidase n=1 Tax=Kwoniella bestiolae CBS 10118 TaxID=1296100 RepID=A0AAJ8MBH4_9TREE
MLFILKVLFVSSFLVLTQGASIPSQGYPRGSIDRKVSRADNTAYFDPKNLVLSSDFEVTNVPKTREYWFEIGTATANPDGYTRQIYTVNGQFPGPLIEVNYGDTLVVHVHNTLDTPQAVHWHGLNQNGTGYMDGVPGISQCPIPPGGSFIYEFPINNRWGTYWWHSHYSNDLQEGIYGPLIVHHPEEPVRRGQDYDEDRIIFVGDWWHDRAEVIVAGLTSSEGYRGTVASPEPDTILINGVGEANCSSSLYPAGASCDPPPRPIIYLPVNKRVRLRFINTASHSHLRLSLDQHDLEVVEADSTPVWGPTLHELPISEAQRYSVIIYTNQGKVGDKFWLRVNQGTACQAVGSPQWALGVIEYYDGATDTPVEGAERSFPTTQAWPDLAGFDQACRDLDEAYTLYPRQVVDAFQGTFLTHAFSSQFGVWTLADGEQRTGFALNNVSYQNIINDPILSVVEREGYFDRPYITNVMAWENGEMDLIINNLDPIDHPFHVHGNDFQIVRRSAGNVTAEQVKAMNIRVANPLRRDTIWIPGLSYAVLRIKTDNPGVWTVHCHIGWHLSQGKLGAIIIRPQDIQSNYARPDNWQDLCQGQDRNAIGPNRRAATASQHTHDRWGVRIFQSLRAKLVQRMSALE